MEQRVAFSIVGAQKCGTRALRHYLSQHPDINMSDAAELHFFDKPENYEPGGPPAYDFYHSRYEKRDGTVWGDNTPIYLYWRPCLPRMLAYNPDMKLIVLLRDPAKRAHSHWNMEYQRASESLPFQKALDQEDLSDLFGRQHRVRSYLARGMYHSQIERLLGYFPRENCCFLRNEELRDDHDRIYSELCAFLDVPRYPAPPARLVQSRDYPPMPRTLRHRLVDFFRSEIEALEKLLDWDCSDWLSMD